MDSSASGRADAGAGGRARAARPSRSRLAVAAVLGVILLASLELSSQLTLVARRAAGLGDRPSAGGLAAAHEAAARSTEQQLRRLRSDLDAEARRELVPNEWSSISFTFEYWSEVGLGVKPTKWGPVAKQLKLLPAIPPPSSVVAHSHPEQPGAPYLPLTWYETARALSRGGGLNATLVAQQPDKRIMLAADVFFVGGCVRLITAPECGWMLDWHNMTIAIHGAWKAGLCTAGGGGGGGAAALQCPPEQRTLRSDGPLQLSRVRSRTVNEWGVIAEFCSRHLAAEEVVDVEFHSWGVSKRFQLTRVDAARRPSEEVAMSVMFFKSSALIPLWLQYWRALGVGRFYLYIKGRVAELDKEDARIAAQLRGDPGVTLVEWDMPFAQAGGVYMVPGRCTGHYSQILSFNHAYERVRRRHLYMGFYDPDEYGLLDPALLQAAWAAGANPLLALLGRYGFPPALALGNRFGAVVEPDLKNALTPSSALDRRWYARAELEQERSKTWVRTMRMREDINVGNHDLFVMVQHSAHPRTGTVFLSGSGYETQNLRQAVHAEREDASFLHVLNFKEHSSKLPFQREKEIARMVEGDMRVPEVAMTFKRAQEMCRACRAGAASPGCGYAC